MNLQVVKAIERPFVRTSILGIGDCLLVVCFLPFAFYLDLIGNGNGSTEFTYGLRGDLVGPASNLASPRFLRLHQP